MKHGSIPSSWLGITGVMSAETNLLLLEAVDERGIDQKDLHAVRAVWAELQEKALKEARELQDRHQAREQEAAEDKLRRDRILATIPGLANKLKKKKL